MSDMNFGEPSGGGFIDSHFDFSRCQRPDGSFYGTGGQCRKGTPAGNRKPADEKKLAKMRKKDLERRGVKEAPVAPAPKKTTSKDPVKGVLKEQQATKDFLKKDGKELAKNPELVKQQSVAKIRKLSNEYERLRGDNSASAAARRKKIMSDVNKLAKVQAKANEQIERNKQGPKRAPDTSPAAMQRRANAAARARD